MRERRVYYTAEECDEGLLSQFLRKKAGLSPHQIRSAKFLPQGICVNGAQARVTTILKAGDLVSILLERLEDPAGSQNCRRLQCHEEVQNNGCMQASPDTQSNGCMQASPNAQNNRGRQRDGNEQALLDIIYEDDDLLIVNKPAGVAMHQAHGHFGDTLSDMAAAHFRKNREERQIRSIGRLDKDTSGIVVFAKNRIAAARLSGKGGNGPEKDILRQFDGKPDGKSEGKLDGKPDGKSDGKLNGELDGKSDDGIKKEYLAVCEGHLPEELFDKQDERVLSIHFPIRRKRGELNRMEVCLAGEGLEAHTYVEKLRECGDNDLLRVRITTGRTHQIRVHLAGLGHPLVGDPIYSSAGTKEAAAGIGRTALHCARVRFRHPLGGEMMAFEAPLPEDMQAILQ